MKMANTDKDLDQEVRRLLQTMKHTDSNMFIDREHFDYQVDAWASCLRPYKGILLDGFAAAQELAKNRNINRSLDVGDIVRGCEEYLRRSRAEVTASEYKDLLKDADKLSSYEKANREVSEEEQLRNEAGHYHKLQEFEKAMNAHEAEKGIRRWRDKPHFPDKDFSRVEPSSSDLPFVPDAAQVEQFETDPEA